MACGCQNTCGCSVIGDGVTASVVGDGPDTFIVSAIPFISAVDDTPCIELDVVGPELALQATLVTDTAPAPVLIECDADGVKATLTIDPASTAPVSQSAAGLRVDCCAQPPLPQDAYPGDYLFWAGVGIRPGYLPANGAAVSRISYSNLWDALSLVAIGAIRSGGSPIINGIPDTGILRAGMVVEATGWLVPTTILSVDSSSQITLATNASNSGIDTEVRAYPYGNGDGLSTFNVPELSRKFPLGYDFHGVSTETISVSGGLEDVTLTTPQMPAHDHNVAVSSSQLPHDHGGLTGDGGSHFHGAGTGSPDLFVTVDKSIDTRQTILEASGGAGDTFDVPVEPDPGVADWRQGTREFTSTVPNHKHSIDSDNSSITSLVTESTVGAGTPHENMPPYIVGRWLVHI